MEFELALQVAEIQSTPNPLIRKVSEQGKEMESMQKQTNSLKLKPMTTEECLLSTTYIQQYD